MKENLTVEQIREVLKNVKAPAARASIIELNQVVKVEVRESSVVVDISLKEHSSLVEKSLKFQIEKAIAELSSDAQVAVNFSHPQEHETAKPQNRIGSIIAVGSGKGGVGKSAVTVNLAVALQRAGHRVGILDCDIYGPSIPTMLGVADQKPMMLNGRIQPIQAFDLKVMSAGFFVEPGQGLIWRGPMIHKLIQQFIQDVDWDGTDVLLVDLPPGTGDAPLSLSQTIPLTGAVMVSMPQKISLIDVHKGASMFNQVKVPILGVIENMSHYVCPSCSHDEEIFDRGGVEKFCKEQGLAYLGDIPIDSRIRKLSDEGRPYLQDNLDSPAGKAFVTISKRLAPFIRTAEDVEELDAIKVSI